MHNNIQTTFDTPYSVSLKCPYRQNVYFPIWSYIPCNELWRKKNFDLDKKRFFYEVLKPGNPILLRSTRAADYINDVLRFVTYIKEHVTSGWTYLACFSSVNLASQSMQIAPFQLFVWTTKFNLQK